METLHARTLEETHARAAGLETGRRFGAAAMYSPVFFLVLMLGVIFNLVPLLVSGGLTRGQNPMHALPVWANTLLTALFLGLIASGPAFVVGVVVRAWFALRLAAMARALRFADMPPLPAIKPGELLGSVLVREISGEGLVIKRRPAPAIIWWPFAWGLVAVFTAMTVAVVGNAYRATGLPGALSAGGFMALWWLIPLPLLKTMTLTVRPGARRDDAGAGDAIEPIEAGAGSVSIKTGIGLFLPRSTRTLTADKIDGVYLTPAGLRIMPRAGTYGRPIDVVGFSPGPLGAWQARRVGTVIEAMLRGPAENGR